MRIALLLAVCALGPAVASSAAGEGGHATATLVTDGARVQPGAKVRVGVRLEMEPGWHVYWSNPGDAGLSTGIDLELPAGWTAGDIRWPVPIRFEQPGGLVGYGYEGEVVLTRELTAPSGAPASVSIPVTASWLACKDVCVLGDARLELVLPAGGRAAEAGLELLDEWSSKLPACDDRAPFSVTTRRDGAAGSIVAWLRWTDRVRDVEWFPELDEAVRIEGQKAVTRGGLTRLDLSVRPAAGFELPSALSSVVAWTDSSGRRRGRCLPIQVRQP